MRAYFLVILLFSSMLLQSCGPDGPAGPQACTPNLSLICEDLKVFEIDSCSEEKREIESCAQECTLGACVNCLPRAGVVCEGGNVAVTNSCGVVEETIQSCENGCVGGSCLPATCEPDEERICDGQRVVSIDSCGNAREVISVCPEERPCTDGFCDGCGVPETLGCYDGDLYEYDLCGERLGRASVCDNSCDGVNRECSLEECSEFAGVVCHEGNLHFRDSCFNVQADIQSECESGCDDEGCQDACLESIVGRVCFRGDVFALTRACENDRSEVSAIIETCQSGCLGGRCAATDCSDNAGVVCEGNSVRALDACGEEGDIIEECAGECERGSCISE